MNNSFPPRSRHPRHRTLSPSLSIAEDSRVLGSVHLPVLWMLRGIGGMSGGAAEAEAVAGERGLRVGAAEGGRLVGMPVGVGRGPRGACGGAGYEDAHGDGEVGGDA